ncbi:hypothetical protein IBTHAUMO2_470014 [Nitrosopumilaceae archaeon]|nr:hypothetical protein IBTHAUMO2_470014 [Nitrosopumilaceae archaeon]
MRPGDVLAALGIGAVVVTGVFFIDIIRLAAIWYPGVPAQGGP